MKRIQSIWLEWLVIYIIQTHKM